MADAERRLEQFWDALNLGNELESAEGLDPTVIETVHQLQRLADAPIPARVQASGWRDVVSRAAAWKQEEDKIMEHVAQWQPVPASVRQNGRPGLADLEKIRSVRRTREAAFGTQAVTAILIVITLVFGYFAFRDERPAAIPPIVATPTTVPTPTPTAEAWPMYRGDPGRTGNLLVHGPAGNPITAWSYQTQGRIDAAAAFVNGVLYIASEDGNLYAIDAETGIMVWTAALGTGSGSSVVVADGVAYVGDNARTLHAIDAVTGQERWKIDGLGATDPGPVVDGIAFEAGTDGSLYAIEATSGEERWSTPLGGGASRSTAYADGLLVVGTNDGHLNAIDATTGALRWSVEMGGGTIGTPALANGVVYASSFSGADNKLIALSATDGSLFWEFQTPTRADLRSPAVGPDTVYTVSGDGNLYALDVKTGLPRATFATKGPITAAPALAGETLYLVSKDGNVYAVNTATGQEQWHVGIVSSTDYGPVVADGMLYVGTDAGVVIAIAQGDQTATPEASSTSSATGTDSSVTQGIPVASTDDLAEFVWATKGNTSAPFSFPGQMAIDPADRIWVADGNNSRFQIFDLDGKYLETWGTPGSGTGEFNFVRADGTGYGSIAFLSDGSFYVADIGNFRIQKFDANRNFVLAWGTRGSSDGQFLDPFGIKLDRQGNVYVADDERDDIQRFDANGTFGMKYGGHGPNPEQFGDVGDLTIDADGNLWSADAGLQKIKEFSPDGTLLQSWGSFGSDHGQFVQPQFIQFDQQGHLFVSDQGTNRVEVFDPTGAYLGGWGSYGSGDGQFNGTMGLLIHDRDAYVTDLFGGRLQKFHLLPPLISETESSITALTPAASPVSFVWAAAGDNKHRLSNPGLLSVDPTGQIWVTSMPGEFLIFDLDGNLVDTWGVTGSESGQFSFDIPGFANAGQIVFKSDGGFYVADLGNQRIQEFDRDRNLIRTWGTKGTADGEFLAPICIAIDAHGDLLVSDFIRNDVQRFSPEGTFVGKFGGSGSGDGEFNNAGCVTIADDGTIWVVDVNGNRVNVFQEDGTFAFSFGGPIGLGNGHLSSPIQVAFDEAGNAYVADQNNNVIQVFDHQGHFLFQFGGFGVGDGEMNSPASVAMYRGNTILVLDWKNNRVEKFKVTGELPAPAPGTPNP